MSEANTEQVVVMAQGEDGVQSVMSSAIGSDLDPHPLSEKCDNLINGAGAIDWL